MEFKKIINLLEQTDDDELKFQTKKWYIINDQNKYGMYGMYTRMVSMVKGIKMILQSNLVQKL